MRKTVKNVDEEEWAALISECIGKRKNFSEHQRRVFATSLPKAIQWGLDQVEMTMPDNDHVKRVRKLVEKLQDNAEELYQLRSISPLVQNAESWVSSVFKDSRSCDIDVKTLWDYSHYLLEHIEDSYAVTKSSAPNNRAAFTTCVIICKLYDKIFGSAPSVSPTDPNKETDSGYYGTPYERVCCAVEEHLVDCKLTYSTRKEARNKYKEGLSKYTDKMFPDQIAS